MPVDSERWQLPCKSHRCYAGKEDLKTSTHSQTQGQSPHDAGWCIRKGGDASRSQGQAWGPFHQTSDRNRAIEGAAVWSEGKTAESKEGEFGHAQAGFARSEEGRVQKDNENFGEAVAGNIARTEERRAFRSVASLDIETGEERGKKKAHNIRIVLAVSFCLPFAQPLALGMMRSLTRALLSL
jgi:hypothetical protein